MGRRDGGGKDWEFVVSRCKLLYIEWINNKILLYSTWNCIQYTVIKHNGKDYEKECIYIYTYIYITESLCYIVEINTTLSINYTSLKFKKISPSHPTTHPTKEKTLHSNFAPSPLPLVIRALMHANLPHSLAFPYDQKFREILISFFPHLRRLELLSVLVVLLWRWKVKVTVKLLSHVWLSATPGTVAYQAPLSMGFSRQEDWSRVPLPSAGDHPESLKAGSSNKEDRE